MTAPLGMPALLTADEAATVLRVKASWLERQAAARKIPFTMLGGCYRFTVGHLRRIVEIYEEHPAVPSQEPSVLDERRTRRRASPDARSTVTPLRARPRRVPNRNQDAA